METISLCFNCSKEIPNKENYFFCGKCLTQVKCKNCDGFLEKDAFGCSNCGTPINNIKTQSTALNNIEFEQKGDVRKFKATFSDSVGSDLVSTFGGIFGLPANKKRLNLFPQLKSNNDSTFSTPIENIDLEDSDDVVDALHKIFKIDGDKLILQTVNFKTKVQLDKAIRISLLTLLASKYLMHQEDTKRSLITDVLNKAKLNLGSFRAWIGKSEEIGKKSGGYVFLTTNGLPTAIKVLNEIINLDIIEGAVTFSKPSFSKRRNKNKATDGELEIVKKSSKTYKDFIENLIADDFFKIKKSLAAIVEKIKDQYAVGFSTSDISGYG